MNVKNFIIIVCIIITVPVIAQDKSELTIYQVMQRVLDRYPSLKISEMEVAQSLEQRKQVESQLGWILNSSASINHDLTGFGTPSDSLDINGAITRQLKSGSSLSLSGGYRYEDNSLSFSPLLPNPAHTTRLDLSYRIPLLQGENNPLYSQGLIEAELSHDLAKANQQLTHVTLAENVKDLYYATALTQARLNNAKESVQRAKKFKAYINKNIKIGLAEEKDRLQANAQLNSKLSDLNSIKLTWEKQKSSLNRLMLEDWNADIQPKLLNFKSFDQNVNTIIAITKNYHPALKIADANLSLAESQINTARDTMKDNLDFVVSVGTRTSDGNNASGNSISEKDWAGAVRFEYRHLFDDQGVNAKLKQAQLQKNIALNEVQKISDDINYTVSGLTSEIQAAKVAVASALDKLNSESLKLNEAVQRYRNGRADTDQVIQFQNDYSFSVLAYQSQRIGLNQRIIALDIFTGRFWSNLSLPQGEMEAKQ